MAEDTDGDARSQRRLAALRAWRSAAVADERIAGDALRDSHLRRLAGSGARTADEVRPRLPSAVLQHLDEIVAVLAAVDEREPAGDGPAAEDTFVAAPGTETGPFPENEVPEFAPPDPARPATPAHEVSSRTVGSGLALSWPPADDTCVIYRVVSRDRTTPWPPDGPATSRIAVTTDCRAVDDRPFGHARRYVDVWRHSGPTPEQAAASTPVWHARGVVIAPVRDVALTQAGDRVVGQWTAPEGASHVEVLRIPAEDVPGGLGDRRYQVRAETDNLHGLDDAGVRRGRTYLYQLRVVAADDDGLVRYSDPVEIEFDVEADLVPIADLAVRPGAVDDVELDWTRPPAGQVLVFRTEEEPPAARSPLDHDEQALLRAGLPAPARLLHPITDLGPGRSGMTRVPWPSSWTRAYFTPVTVLDGRARIGTPAGVVRAGVVTRPRIVERVHKEVVTFGWPSGAAAVALFQGVVNQDPATAVSGPPPRTVQRDRYAREGGMHLDPPLPGLGCSVHLVPIAYDGGQPVHGPTTSMNYRGLLRMHYKITFRRNLARWPTSLTVWLWSDMELAGPPPFVLVGNPDRLPLEIGDGQPVRVTAAWDATAAPVVRITPPPMRVGENPDLGWVADARGLEGWYVRLFADVDESRRSTVALLDPPLEQLRLLRAPRRLGAR